MQFTEVVVGDDGELGQRRQHAAAAFLASAEGTALTPVFRHILDAYLRGAGDRPARFRCMVYEEGWGEMVWHQADPYSAFVSFWVRGSPASRCLLLSGADPVRDTDTVAAVQALHNVLAEAAGETPGRGLHALVERPALVHLARAGGLGARDRLLLHALVLALATAFFERAVGLARRTQEDN